MPDSTATTKPSSTILPGLPKRSLTARQQLEALQRVQGQAEQRVKLGVQLFKAAEARTSQYQAMLDQIKAEQEEFRTEFSQDMARSFQVYDKWLGQIDETLTDALSELESKLDKLGTNWAGKQDRTESLINRSEQMLEQSRDLLRSTQDKLTEQAEAVRRAMAQRVQPDEAVAEMSADLVQIDTSSADDQGVDGDISLDDTAEMEAIEVIPLEDDSQLTVAAPPPAELESEPAEADAPQGQEPNTGGSEHFYRDVLAKLHEQQRKNKPPPETARWSIPS